MNEQLKLNFDDKTQAILEHGLSGEKQGYGQYGELDCKEDLQMNIVRMCLMVATCYPEFQQATHDKILFADDFTAELSKYIKNDLEEGYYLHNLVKCYQDVFEKETAEEVISECTDRFNYFLEEDNSRLIYTVKEGIELLENTDGYLVFPKKWFSNGIYKSIGEFLKTFDCERTKYQGRVAYKNNGEFTNEQIIAIGNKLNGVSLSTKFDFFPTPKELVEKVREYADIQNEDSILEPSAGTGSLVNGLENKDIDCVEINQVLSVILSEKGHKVYNSKFEDFSTQKKYDKILMNPPFGKRLDAQHIVKAYKFLAENGTLVAIHSNAISTANDKSSKEFQELFKKYGRERTEIPAGSFKNSGKGTNVAVTISVFNGAHAS